MWRVGVKQTTRLAKPVTMTDGRLRCAHKTGKKNGRRSVRKRGGTTALLVMSIVVQLAMCPNQGAQYTKKRARKTRQVIGLG